MKKLKAKLIRTVLLCVAGVFLLLAAILYLSLNFHSVRQADLMTQIICENNGIVPPSRIEEAGYDSYPLAFNEESAYRTRYFIVYLDQDGQIDGADLEHVAMIGEEKAREMAANVQKSGKTVGFEGRYRYRVSSSEDGTTYIVFLDYSENKTMTQAYFLIMSVVFIGFILLISVAFIICSNFVLKPFEENSQRQKQFVTDAGHDLKTPLAIISANAQVLEYKSGKNEWTEVIREEIRHMSKLIDDLLTLSRLQESENEVVMESVDFSRIVTETTDKFQEAVSSRNGTLEETVQPRVFLRGNEEQLRQLTAVLVENAAKYMTDSGKIRIVLFTLGRKATLQVFNTAKLGEDFDCGKLFERFYRADNSRTSATGGHGIGLSIAKRIVEFHGGTIRAGKKEDGLLFTVSLPGLLTSRVDGPSAVVKRKRL